MPTETEPHIGAALKQWLSFVRRPMTERTTRELREMVWQYVDDRKAAGWLPERVIVAVKQIAREAGLRPSVHVASPKAEISTTDELLVEMVGWVIHRYYSSAR
jgi:hypothetical protein